jgi:formylmethanofuran dehydrogenase subunit C
VNPLVLEPREPPRQPVDMSPLSNVRTLARGPADINALKLWCGKRQLPVGELFAVGGEDPSRVVIRNCNSMLELIGAGLSVGSIEVEGDAGAYLGQDMRGGQILVRGNCGDFCASGLSGGFIRIDGDVGDFLGAAACGKLQGMRGGQVLIRGSAGDRVADRMRRGDILVEGNAGDYCCSRMLAGTVAVLGNIGASIGVGMRRGTLLLANNPPSMPATFIDTGAHILGFLTLWARKLRGQPGLFGRLDPSRQWVHRCIGDQACGGLGEVLVWIRNPTPDTGSEPMS